MRRVALGLVVPGLAVGSAMALAGCATLNRGMTDEVAVISDPVGATVTTSLGVGCAATPCSVLVARDAVFDVTVAKAGYASRTVAVTTRVSGSGAALASENVTTAGLGLAVDAATGAALEHVPDPVDVTLAKLANAGGRPPRAGHGRPKPAPHPAT